MKNLLQHWKWKWSEVTGVNVNPCVILLQNMQCKDL